MMVDLNFPLPLHPMPLEEYIEFHLKTKLSPSETKGDKSTEHSYRFRHLLHFCREVVPNERA